MRLISTRTDGKLKPKKSELSEAILNPSAEFGGLYAPKKLPKLEYEFFQKGGYMSYAKFAIKLIKEFKFDVSKELFKTALKRYESFDDANEPVPLVKIAKNLYVNELYHGPTRAFKDMALQPFGALLAELAKERGERYLVACATSGDTGPATLETFANASNVNVVCLYPDGGTSAVQRLQMATASALNLKVIAINGNFDDAQRVLKELLASDEFKSELERNGLKLSAANSVNFGRILFQIIYHAYAYARLIHSGELSRDESFDVIVPSGNFGNALGAYYAKKMGAKIGVIKIVSNENNILTEFFTTGRYDLRGKSLIKTISPAMDILISSNVERLLFDKFGAIRTKELMDKLKSDKFYELTKAELAALNEDFEADFCTDSECKKQIAKWAKKGVLLDPHTATCLKMRDKERLSVITSTADWVKFTPSMVSAIKPDAPECAKPEEELSAMLSLGAEYKAKVPVQISKLFKQEVLHSEILDPDKVASAVLGWLK
ncbi:threonine synthase [Campylobacter sp. 19-13652]|uniref:threonine synthase n=1 Tax=Campylobacter sp. 19-13652 TaxID=2840180 RepID=UPI001C78DAE8|nr:threonine synthase [Campylobacter sp. 19-13652]BCX79301.1 threonine synthase [Campylobacter sp. 19-13652]